MLKLFIGLALAVLNYDINLSGHVIGIFPHFLGFFLIVLGIQEMEKKDDTFTKAMLPAYIMLVYSLAFYAAKSFGASLYLEEKMPYLLYFIQLLETVGTMLVAYFITFAYTHYEHKNRMDVGCKKLQTFWKVMCIGFIVYYVGYMTVLMYGSALSNVEAGTKGADAAGSGVYASFVFYQFANIVRSATTLIYLFMYYKVFTKFIEQKR
ncbi:MAG: hypothetical protein K5656_05320 [Lachnospiraceae bacterium]|nr:hypothetical protein [Lachnospiraceae bacterium]